MNYLSILIFLPLATAILCMLLPKGKEHWYKPLTIATAFMQLVISLYLFYIYRDNPNGFQFVEKYDWIYLKLGSLGNLNIDYFLAVDGISIAMLLLTSLVMLGAAFASTHINHNKRGYFILFNILSMAVIGVFCALDFFLFYVFYELMLLPLYFLIGMWGGPNREYASLKFFLYTLFGSVFMLLVMVGLYLSVLDPQTGDHTFNILHMMDAQNFKPHSVFHLDSPLIQWGAYSVRYIAFIVMFIAFAIKVPVFPLHTWLPDAHVEAPTPVSMILAGILLKVGAYGIIRICYGIFPEAATHFSYYIGLIGMISIIYGALNALAAKDLKRLVAYSSVSHMGFVIIGIASLTSEGLNGALYQMFSHGILSALLFFAVGVIYHRVKDRSIANFSGLAQQMPRYTAYVVIAFFASLGLPGMSGFIGEAFTIIGALKSESVNGLLPHWIGIVSALGILAGAIYFLWTLQRMFLGEKRLKEEDWKTQLGPLTSTENILMFITCAITIVIGVFPNLLFQNSNSTVNEWISYMYQNGFINLINP